MPSFLEQALPQQGVYVERPDGSLRCRWVKAPANGGLSHLTRFLARGIGRYLERQGLLERNADDCMDAGGRATKEAKAENSYLAGDGLPSGPLDQLLGSSIAYRIAVGCRAWMNRNAPTEDAVPRRHNAHRF